MVSRGRGLPGAALAARGGGDDALEGGTQPNEQSSVTVGSTNFSEQLILAEMYAAVLKKAGVNVDTRLNLGAREVVFPALEKGEIDLLPEYNGSVLSFLNPEATQTTADEVNTALTPLLEGKGLVALEPSPAEDKDGFAVTKETADKYGLAKISDLKGKAGQLVIGGPPELKTRPSGIPGLKKVYGIEDFKEFKALDAGGPPTTSASTRATSTSAGCSPPKAPSPRTTGCSWRRTSPWNRPRTSCPSGAGTP